MRISVFGSRELQTVILGLKNQDRDARKEIRQRTKAMAQPEWQKAVAEQASTRLENRVLAATARVTVSDQNVQLQSARIGRKLSGGLLPTKSYAAVEFGGDRAATNTYEARSRLGKRYQVTRRTRAQLRPSNRTGYAVYPAAARMIPRLAALWVQTYVRTLHEKLEGR